MFSSVWNLMTSRAMALGTLAVLVGPAAVAAQCSLCETKYSCTGSTEGGDTCSYPEGECQENGDCGHALVMRFAPSIRHLVDTPEGAFTFVAVTPAVLVRWNCQAKLSAPWCVKRTAWP